MAFGGVRYNLQEFVEHEVCLLFLCTLLWFASWFARLSVLLSVWRESCKDWCECVMLFIVSFVLKWNLKNNIDWIISAQPNRTFRLAAWETRRTARSSVALNRMVRVAHSNPYNTWHYVKCFVFQFQWTRSRREIVERWWPLRCRLPARTRATLATIIRSRAWCAAVCRIWHTRSWCTSPQRSILITYSWSPIIGCPLTWIVAIWR